MRDDSSIQFDEGVRLMMQAQKGDRQAYGRLYEKYVPAVRRYIAHRGRLAEPQEDLVQEVFTRVWEHRAKYRPGMAVCPYLLGFAQNVFREHQARIGREIAARRHQPLRAVEGISLGPEAAARHNDQAERVRSGLAELPPKQRQSVELVYLLQVSVAEAAKVMNCSPEALRQNLYEARRRLETTFYPAGEESESA
jgi:RNA polymerase sigma-70 factor (ECF subfamily)